jgi:hypothetical protein
VQNYTSLPATLEREEKELNTGTGTEGTHRGTGVTSRQTRIGMALWCLVMLSMGGFTLAAVLFILAAFLTALWSLVAGR